MGPWIFQPPQITVTCLHPTEIAALAEIKVVLNETEHHLPDGAAPDLRQGLFPHLANSEPPVTGKDVALPNRSVGGDK